MNALPERKLARFTRQVSQIYTSRPQQFPELTYRRLLQEAQSMISAGGSSALDGHILSAALAPITLDIEAFDRHITAARYLSGNGPDAWVNEALFAVYFGASDRSSRILRQHIDEILGDIELAGMMYDLSIWCCLVETAMVLANALERVNKADGLREFPCLSISNLLAERGMSEFDLVERFAISARAGVQATNRPVRGYRIIGNTDVGYAYDLLFDAPLSDIVDAGVAMANAVTEAFQDDLGDIITFSAGRYIGQEEHGG